MQTLEITLVTGSSGAGKTTWIQQQIRPIADTAIYLSLGSDETAIDATYLAAEIPGLTVLPVTHLANFSEQPPDKHVIYLELGFHVDLTSLILPDKMVVHRRVAVLPPGTRHPECHDWADLVVTGVKTSVALQQPHLWRSVLSGQVLDLASLNTFWYELTHGAYGTIQRAKGIFDVADGRSLYFDFVAGLPETTHLELNLPLWLNGRPDRFSGIEVVGEMLDQEAIAQTIKECCLNDQAIAYYQQQIKDSLEPGDEVA
ncbi:GTP-binding protein [Leptothermofonsia sichuanensis E412]|uniref:GTP-binding protein n=1 Tax=Leptothermofonsia sichuanensis TaxID=2917832 RepID=UPI001CA75578|nr:GTP-binding protein [Leptothermofonsia sichuanensis]QZZ19289.1 GTP-binding protein [Leptothermofonsia sichuanensis E412]